MGRYLRYFGTHLLLLATGAGLLAGGGASWLGLIVGVAGWIGSDALSPPVSATTEYPRRWLLDFALYSLFPPLVLLTLVFAWSQASGDFTGIGAFAYRVLEYDALGARNGAGVAARLGAALSFGLAVAMGGILVAHELVHRTGDARAMWVGRWMLAMAFNASLEVAHVFGHHRDVGTRADPTTARRGESVYRFYVRSTWGQILQAWAIEQTRLRGASPGTRLRGNRVVRGALRAWSVAALFYLAGGWTALGVFMVSAAFNKLLLEALNYMEHYGLVRMEGRPIEQRHSWNSRSAFSHAALFNLPYHADHHARAGVQYPELHASSDAPVLDTGYLASLPLTLLPPLWMRRMAPRLAAWDREQASAEERRVLVQTD